MATSHTLPEIIPLRLLPVVRRPPGPLNPPRALGKHRVKPWPSSAERKWATDRHKFVWELSDAAYDSFRAWVIRVEAGEPNAVALAEVRDIKVVERNGTGKRDRFRDPEDVLLDVSNALRDRLYDDPDNLDASEEGEINRFVLHTRIANAIIREIFGCDHGVNIALVTEHCHEAQGQEDYDLPRQRERAEDRLEFGIANERDRTIQAMGPDYWD